MTKGEIKAKLDLLERAQREKEVHRLAFDELENAEYEAQKDLDDSFRKLTGLKRGIVMVGEKAYSFGGGIGMGIQSVPVVNLDVFVGDDVSDPRCVKSINPHFNPADLEGVAS